MNKKQKYILIVGIILIAAALTYWITQGAEIFTKTQVLIDKSSDLDKMLGVKNEQYVDKFVFGLIPSGNNSISEMSSFASISGIITFLSGIFIYLFRNTKKEIK